MYAFLQIVSVFETLINIYILFPLKYADTLGAKCRILLVMNEFLIEDFFYEILSEIPQNLYYHLDYVRHKIFESAIKTWLFNESKIFHIIQFCGSNTNDVNQKWGFSDLVPLFLQFECYESMIDVISEWLL